MRCLTTWTARPGTCPPTPSAGSWWTSTARSQRSSARGGGKKATPAAHTTGGLGACVWSSLNSWGRACRSRSLTERHEGGPRSERAVLGLFPSGLFTRSCGTAPFRQRHTLTAGSETAWFCVAGWNGAAIWGHCQWSSKLETCRAVLCSSSCGRL